MKHLCTKFSIRGFTENVLSYRYLKVSDTYIGVHNIVLELICYIV